MNSCVGDLGGTLPDALLSTYFYVGFFVLGGGTLLYTAALDCRKPSESKAEYGFAAAGTAKPLAVLCVLLTFPKLVAFVFFRDAVRGELGNEIACQASNESLFGVPIIPLILAVLIILFLIFNQVRLCALPGFTRLLTAELQRRLAGAGGDGPGPLRGFTAPAFRGAWVPSLVHALRAVAQQRQQLVGKLSTVEAEDVEVSALDAWGTRYQPLRDDWLRANMAAAGVGGAVASLWTDFSSLPLVDGAADAALVPLARSLPFMADPGESARRKELQRDAFLAASVRALRPGGVLGGLALVPFETAGWEAALRRAGLVDVSSRPEWIWASFIPCRLACGTKPAPATADAAAGPTNSTSETAAAAVVPVTATPGDDEEETALLRLSVSRALRADHALSAALEAEHHHHPRLAAASSDEGFAAASPLAAHVPYFPAGWVWRLRDALLVTAVALWLCAAGAVLSQFLSLQVPRFVSWGNTLGALALSSVLTAPVALYYMAGDLSRFVAGSVTTSAAAGWSRQKQQQPKQINRDVDSSSISAVENETVVPLLDEVAGEGGGIGASGSASTAARPDGGNRVDEARRASAQQQTARSSQRASSSGLLDLGQPAPASAVLWHFASELRNVVLGLTLYQAIFWLPSFATQALALQVLHASTQAADTATLVVNIVVIPLVIFCGRRAQAAYSARREQQLQREEAAEVAAAASDGGAPALHHPYT